MNRRAFLYGPVAAALVAPLTARAQQAEKIHRIGFLTPAFDPFTLGLRVPGRLELLPGHPRPGPRHPLPPLPDDHCWRAVLREHTTDDSTWWGRALVVEPRYLADIAGAQADGLEVRG